ncbi:hypothetical protein BSAF29S_02040 [Bacillus safensis subsp. safensis]
MIGATKEESYSLVPTETFFEKWLCQSADRDGKRIAVLGALAVMNIAIKPPVLFAFMLFCGAPVAKIATARYK